MGGENAEDRQAALKKMGSSPRGRGKRKGRGLFADVGGLIPAWAGKTGGRGGGDGEAQAHPRVGGENRRERLPAVVFDGSSPRRRGKRKPPPGAESRSRLIPA